MDRSGNIINYVMFAPGVNGAPSYDVFTNFGSSMVMLGDVDGDNISDIAVGASQGNT